MRNFSLLYGCMASALLGLALPSEGSASEAERAAAAQFAPVDKTQGVSTGSTLPSMEGDASPSITGGHPKEGKQEGVTVKEKPSLPHSRKKGPRPSSYFLRQSTENAPTYQVSIDLDRASIKPHAPHKQASLAEIRVEVSPRPGTGAELPIETAAIEQPPKANALLKSSRKSEARVEASPVETTPPSFVGTSQV